jgi:hypothetical protein
LNNFIDSSSEQDFSVELILAPVGLNIHMSLGVFYDGFIQGTNWLIPQLSVETFPWIWIFKQKTLSVKEK